MVLNILYSQSVVLRQNYRDKRAYETTANVALANFEPTRGSCIVDDPVLYGELLSCAKEAVQKVYLYGSVVTHESSVSISITHRYVDLLARGADRGKRFTLRKSNKRY